MKTNILILVLLTLSTLGISIKAQNNNTVKKADADTLQETTKARHYIGMAAGYTIGYGPSYEIKFKKVGVQLVFTPYKDQNRTQHSIGFTPKYTFFSNSSVEVFSYLGTHYLYKKERTTQINTLGKEEIQSKNKSILYNGLGAGILIGSESPINLQLMSGFLSKNMFQELNLTTEATIVLSLNKKDWK